jgi:hypothetical protein
MAYSNAIIVKATWNASSELLEDDGGHLGRVGLDGGDNRGWERGIEGGVGLRAGCCQIMGPEAEDHSRVDGLSGGQPGEDENSRDGGKELHIDEIQMYNVTLILVLLTA